MAGLQLRQIISKAVEMEEVTDELKKRFIRLYEKDLKIRHMAFGNIGTLTRQLKTAIKRGDIIEATRIESLRDARRLSKNEVFQVVKILLRFIVHCRPDFFNDHDRARLLKQANPSSYEKCSVARIRLRDLLLNEPKYLEAIEEIASICKELSPPDLLDLSKEANTSDKKLHAPKGSIAA